MKIALIGSHGTGKTTAVHEIIALLKKNSFDAGYLEEIARTCPLPINEEATLESQKWIFYQHFVKEIELSHRNNILVCDRSLIDIYAYYVRKFGRNEAMESLIRENLKSYSILFYFPIDKYGNRLHNDKIRATNKKFQIEIDETIKSLLVDFKIDYFIYDNAEDAFKKINSLNN